MKKGDKLRVFNIQRLSLNDGPGIRTTVFLKGCNFRCIWCHNPESIAPQPQIMKISKLCTCCGVCKAACIYDAIDSGFNTDSSKCVLCRACIKACVYGAREICGKDYDIDEIVNIVSKDKQFYKESGGGVTVSGGEPMLQYEGLKILLERLKHNGISTAIDTNGHADSNKFSDICEIADIVLFDLKHMDNDIHKKLTGVGNNLIHENFKMLCYMNKEIYVRYPMIKDLNDDEDNIVQMCDFLKRLNISKIDVIPYHDIGENKYYSIGTVPVHIEKHTEEEIKEKIAMIRKQGINPNII